MSPGAAATKNHGRLVLCFILALIQLLAAAAIVIAWPRPADASASQSSVSTVATYVVDADLESVAVTERFMIASSVESFEAFIPHGVNDVTVSHPFDRSAHDQFWDAVTISPGGSSWVDLSYTVNSSEIRTQRGALVNDSFIGFSVWPTNASDVAIVIPDGYVIAENRGLFEVSRLPTGQLEYAANFPSDLQDYSFVAFRGESFESRVVKVEGDSIQIAGWIGDDSWLNHTERYVTEGLPVLRDLIGLEWPEQGLQIVESDRPSDLGYGGWYIGRRSLIEISDSLNEETLLHELSHAWFNGDTYTDRWIMEGLANELASEAVFLLDGVKSEPRELGPSPQGWDGLLNWQYRFRSNHSWDVEYFGYETSWSVLDALSDDLGPDGMRTVIAEMQSNVAAYGLPSDPLLLTDNDWRRFLDVLQDHGNSDEAESIYRQWVMPADLEFVLDARAQLRADIDYFSDGDLAQVPLAIRRAMARWEFDEARDQLDQAKALLRNIETLGLVLAELDLPTPEIVAELYLSSGPDFAVARQTLSEAEGIMRWFEAGNGSETDRENWSLGRFELIDWEDIAVPETFGRELNTDQADALTEWLRWGVPLTAFLFVILATSMLVSRLNTSDQHRPADPFVT